jgi:hypothetical protein
MAMMEPALRIRSVVEVFQSGRTSTLRLPVPARVDDFSLLR